MPDKRATEENIFSWSRTDIEKDGFEGKWERDAAVEGTFKDLIRYCADGV
jgi:hypothetical protein